MKVSSSAQNIITLFVASLLFPTVVLAQGILITDCQGFTRALHSSSSGELNTVKVSVNSGTGNVNGAQVTLTNSATGEVSTAVAENGVAVFEGVSPGTFSVGTTATNTSIGTVSVSSAGFGTAAATGAAVGTAGAVGGGGAVVGKEINDQYIEDDNDNDDSGSDNNGDSNGNGTGDGADPESTPTPAPTPQATPVPTPQRPPSNPDPTPRPTPDCSDCDPDETPPPLDDDDFFRDRHMKPQQQNVRGETPLSPHS